MKDLIIEIFNTRKERREIVHKSMFSLHDEQKNCLSCTGICCTSIANSMQIDNVQAIDMYLYLKRRDMFDVEELRRNIQEHNLKILHTGKGSLRKRYTCPYYAGGSLGCRISINSKPYGCLAFNPIGTNVKAGENCRSYTESLEKREEASESKESLLNIKVSESFGLINDKQAIPIKLLEVHESYLKNLKLWDEMIQSFNE